jgi:hypothetical protein
MDRSRSPRRNDLEARLALCEARIDALEWQDSQRRLDKIEHLLQSASDYVTRLWDWIPFLQAPCDWMKAVPSVEDSWVQQRDRSFSMDP